MLIALDINPDYMGSPINDGKWVTNPELSRFAIANDEQRICFHFYTNCLWGHRQGDWFP